MTIENQKTITKEEVVAKFNERVRDWVASNTNFISSTPLFYGTRTFGQISVNSTAYGGGINRNANASATPQSATVAQLDNVAGASKDLAGQVVKVMKDMMVLYTNSHKVNIRNTGNTPANEPVQPGANDGAGNYIAYVGVGSLDGAPAATKTSVQADVDAAAISNNIITGKPLGATNFLNFVEACRSIWTNRANTSALEEFVYNYCHNSCHSNVTCYSARGRR